MAILFRVFSEGFSIPIQQYPKWVQWSIWSLKVVNLSTTTTKKLTPLKKYSVKSHTKNTAKASPLVTTQLIFEEKKNVKCYKPYFFKALFGDTHYFCHLQLTLLRCFEMLLRTSITNCIFLDGFFLKVIFFKQYTKSPFLQISQICCC